jgi:hypothetical protein
MSLLPVAPAHALAECPVERRWLIDGLWADQAVGIVGGEPKCCKSFLALDMAVAVASGAPCLRRFPVSQTGRVLLYAAEDALHVVRRRLVGICRAAGVALEDLDLQVITAPTLRLDLAEDQARLLATVDALRPRMLVLDPFVRLHRVDENVAGAVAPLLAYLRDLQRSFQVAVVVVHHARKGAGNTRGGQALRGSSEFHAWVDVTLYLRRLDDGILLAAEHRAAPSLDAVPLALVGTGDALALAIRSSPTHIPDLPPLLTPLDKVAHVLGQSNAPLSVDDIRRACHIRTAHVCDALNALVRDGRARKTAAGYLSGGA